MLDLTVHVGHFMFLRIYCTLRGYVRQTGFHNSYVGGTAPLNIYYYYYYYYVNNVLGASPL